MARDVLAELVASGGPLLCEQRGHDRYQGVLARSRGGAENENLGRAMVRAGWALTYPGADAYALEE